MVSTGFLAQASMSRLGEINRGSPKLLHASSRSYFTRVVAQATHVLSERANISPKREGSRLSEIPREVTVPPF